MCVKSSLRNYIHDCVVFIDSMESTCALVITGYICNVADDSYCIEGSVTVVSDVNNSSLQLVEMCSSEGVWSPVCDYDWTLKDTSVVCRQLEHMNHGNSPSKLRSLYQVQMSRKLQH